MKIVADERRRDALLAQGFKLCVEEAKEQAAAPEPEAVPEAAPIVKPKRIPMKTKKK